MNKKILLMLILLSSFSISCTTRQGKKEISFLQIVDRNGLSETITAKEKLTQYKNVNFDQAQPYQKVLRIYKKDPAGNATSVLTCYHDNGQIWKSLEIKNSRAYGPYKEWYYNGKLKIEAFVIGGTPDFNQQDQWLFDGICRVFNENGKILSEFTYEKGILNGPAKYYFSDGSIKKTIPYNNNEINGEAVEYADNGDVFSKISYKNGIKNGPAIGFWHKDNISFIEDYENGLLINAQYFKKSRIRAASIKNREGQKIQYTKNGFQLIEYKNGKPEGKIQTYQNNQLINEFYQKTDIKDGIETEYYRQNEISSYKKAVPKLEIPWSNNSIHGTVKTWYKNGKLESQKDYCKNKKNGHHFAWYENGFVMFIEEYENNSLIKGSYYQINQKEPVSTVIKGNGEVSLFDSKGRFIKKVTYKEGQPFQ